MKQPVVVVIPNELMNRCIHYIKLSTKTIFIYFLFVFLILNKYVHAETHNFGNEVPSVDEFVTALTPAPSFRGIRRISTKDLAPTISMNIKFSIDSYDLDQTSQHVLDNLSEALKSPELESSKFVIEGHTDATGSEEYNLNLSIKRATSVENYLVDKGVDISRLTTVGKGEKDLLDTTRPNSGVNRRVAIINMGQ